jgi:Zn-dependent protease
MDVEPVREDYRGYEPIQPKSGLRDLFKKLAAPFIFLGLLFLKLKGALLALVKFKFAANALSMVVSVGAYALFFGWWFAVGFVLLIFVHEMGHYFAIRAYGYKVGLPVFIPFLGAYVAMKELPSNVWREFVIAIAGPVVGSLGALACWLVGASLDSDLWRALAYVGFFLNLFNLIPLTPFDGGRIVAALHPALWAVGLVGMAALLFFFANPFIFIFLLIGAYDAWHRWKARKTDPGARAYYQVSPRRRVVVLLSYVALAVALVVGMQATQVEVDN